MMHTKRSKSGPSIRSTMAQQQMEKNNIGRWDLDEMVRERAPHGQKR